MVRAVPGCCPHVHREMLAAAIPDHICALLLLPACPGKAQACPGVGAQAQGSALPTDGAGGSSVPRCTPAKPAGERQAAACQPGSLAEVKYC